MANIKISTLYNIGTGIADEDLFVVVDNSALTSNSMSWANIIAIANTHVQAKIDTLVDSAPDALNTLNELAAALGDDENFATTITISLGQVNSNVLALQGGIDGTNSLLASSNTAAVSAFQSNDYITFTRLDANINLVQDNVASLTTTVDSKDSVSNVYATYLTLSGGLTGANSAIATNEATRQSNAEALAAGIAASGGTDLTNIVTGIEGSNARIAAEEANVIALQGGLAGANSNQVAIATFADDTGVWQAGNLIPKANGVYSLGAADALWKDLFISAGSIKLGGVTISAADDEGITIAGASGNTTSIVTPTVGGVANVSANIAFLESNVTILLGSTAGQNTRIAAEEANVINLQTGLAGANTALTNEISATNVDVTNLVTGIGGSNSRIAAEEANVIALQSGISGSNSRIVAEEANVISLQAGLTGANTNISSNDTDITNLVTGLGGSNTNITALEARRSANTSIFLGAFTGSNTRISAEEANVIALQGGISGANTAISGNDTDITNLITGLDGSNVTIATKDSVANVYATYLVAKGGIDGANAAISSNDTDITNLITGLDGANTTIATKAATTYVDSQIAAIVDSAPETLNTLNELAAALGDDANFATTTATQIGTISSNTVNLQAGITGSNTNITANETRRAANTLILLGAFTGSNARISAEEANVIALQGGIAGANTALADEIAATNTDITNLVTGLDGANTNVTALEARRAANTSIFLGAFTGSNTRIAAEEANVIALQGGLAGANTALSNEIAATNTDITNLVTGLEGSNTTIATKDSVANVYATYLVAKGGIDGANTNISSNDTDITNLVTGLDGSNTTIATKDSVANVYATYLVAKGGIDGANTNISSNDTDITNLVTGLDGSNTTIATKDSVANVYATYLVAKGGIDGANTNITSVEARRTANIAGAVSSITTSDLTASRALTSDGSGKVDVSAVTSTELGYLDGVTSAIQTQLDAKLEGNQTITLSGDVSGSGTTSITVTVADDSHNHVISNIDNLQTSLDEKDTVANVYTTYLVAKGGIEGANSAISSNDTDITNLVTGLEGSNTNITALEARRAANTAILLGAHSGANARIAAEEANVIALQGGIAGANTAIGLRATTASPTFTGVPAAPTAAAGTSTTQIATTAFVGTAVANIVDSAPEALDTLNELAAALGDDANFSTTVSTQIGTISSNTVTNATNITAVEARRVANIAGAVSSITTGDLTASRALVSDGSGKVAVSAVTSTELGYLDGVSSAIQTQLEGKQASGSYLTGNQTITLSGDASGSGTTSIVVTVADDSHNHIISNIDGLQTALDAKLASSSYTAADVLTKIKTVDGAGSGLDADLLDGVQGSAFLRTDGSTVATNLVRFQGGLTIGSDNDVYLYESSAGAFSVRSGSSGAYNYLTFSAAGALTIGGSTVWHSGNDGAGSGLDADLLDGQSSAYYAIEATRSSNATQLAAGIASAGGTMTADEIRALGFFDTSNDGSGSELDADTVDGIQGASFLRSDASDTYTSGTLTFANGTSLDLSTNDVYLNARVIQNASGGGDDGMYIGFANSNSGLTRIYGGGSTSTHLAVDSSTITFGGSTVWHAGNDGSGSGLDADTLDGQQGSYYAPIASPTFTGTVTYSVLSGSGTSTRDKIRVWTSSAYAIGMGSGYTFGALNDFAMSFQMNDDADRGWWWGHSVHTNAQGSMSLTTDGELTVAKSISISGSETATSGSTGLYMFDDGNPHIHGDNNLWINSTTGDVYINNQNNGNVILTNGTGKVGIGTTSPSTLLHLTSTGPAILTLEADTDNVTETDNARIELSQDGGGVTAHMGYGSGTNGIDIWNDHNDYVRIGTNNSERVRIDSSGNVGIGTTAPSAGLDVVPPNNTRGIETTVNDTVANQSLYAHFLDVNMSGSDTCTTDRTHVGLYLDIDSSATGGDVDNEHRIYGSYVDVDVTGDSDLIYGAFNSVRSTHSSGTISDQRAAYNIAEADGTGTVTNLFGSANYALSGTAIGSPLNVYATWSKYLKEAADSGTTNAAYGMWSEVEIDGGTITNAYGVRSTIDRDGGTIGNGYLFYGDFQGSSGTRWGVYITGESKNYFSGNVGIGDTTPSYKLDVTGDINFTGTLYQNGSALIPAGFIGMWGAAAAPSGWYLCEGGAISRTTYSALFSAIGTTYGAGDGSTTFNVPDFRDRAPYGASTYTLGSKTTNEINGSAQAATSSGGPTTHSVTTSTTNSTTDKDVTNSITVVTGVSAHAAHSHTVTYPAVAVKFIIKT